MIRGMDVAQRAYDNMTPEDTRRPECADRPRGPEYSKARMRQIWHEIARQNRAERERACPKK